MVSLLFALFLFVNIYIPFSFHYAMVINIVLLLFIKFVDKSSTAVIDKRAIIITLVLILFSFIIVILRTGSFSLYLSVNYIYYLFCVISYPYIIDYFLKKKVDVLSCISFVLTIHCVVVLMEVLSPEFSAIKASYFFYNREDIDRFLLLDFRKMGLVSSFDVSGFIAGLSTVLAFLLFLSKGRVSFFILFTISAASSIFTSRAGMMMAFLGVVASAIFYKGNALRNKTLKFFKMASLIASIFIGVMILMPIISTDFGINTVSNNSIVTDIQDDYVEGSTVGLLEHHTKVIYKLSADEIVFGSGQIFRDVQNKRFGSLSTDIGYIRQIFEIGIIGLSIMLFFIYKNWVKIRYLYRKVRTNNNGVSMLYLLYTMLIVGILLMNYKNYFIFAKGSFSLYLLIYYLLLHNLVRGTLYVNRPRIGKQ